MPTKKLEELYGGEKQQILHEQEMVEMVDEEEVEEPLPPGEPAGAPEKDPMTGEDSEYEDDSSRAYNDKKVEELKTESLSIYLGEAVKESERIPESAKEDFIKNIEEADLYGLMSLIMDGKLESPEGDEAKASLEQRFEESHWIEIHQEAGVAGNILTMAALLPVGGPVAWGQWRILASMFSKAHRRCGVLRVSKERDACLKKVRMDNSLGKIKLMTKLKASCKKHKNPAKCAKSIDANIAKEMKKVEKFKAKLQKAAMKGKVGAGPAKSTQVI